ncbi:hypothetical protein K7B06_31725 [Streptomyces erythrochromogenes]|nr:hypothetical protein [Streptomyces erythrochromogenes]
MNRTPPIQPETTTGTSRRTDLGRRLAARREALGLSRAALTFHSCRSSTISL